MSKEDFKVTEIRGKVVAKKGGMIGEREKVEKKRMAADGFIIDLINGTIILAFEKERRRAGSNAKNTKSLGPERDEWFSGGGILGNGAVGFF